MSVALRQVTPNGTRWGEIGEYFPDWSDLEFGQEISSTAGSITFKYPKDGVNYNLLKNGIFITPAIDGNRSWFDSIFYVQELQGVNEQVSDRYIRTFAGVSLTDRLSNIRWMPAFGSKVMDSYAFRQFNVTPGSVIKEGVHNYKSRARQKGDNTDWISNVMVSADTRWRYRVDEDIEATTSVLDIIQKYEDMGIATAKFRGFELCTSHYDWYTGEDADKTDVIQYRYGVDLLSEEYAESYTDLVTALLVVGAENPFASGGDDFQVGKNCEWVIADQEVIDRFGYRESSLEVSSATQHTTLKAIGENYLSRRIAPRYSKTYAVANDIHDPVSGKPVPTPRPLVDYQCGDLISVLSSEGKLESHRVVGISMTYKNPSTAVVALTLNDHFDSWEVKFDQRLKQLEK